MAACFVGGTTVLGIALVAGCPQLASSWGPSTSLTKGTVFMAYIVMGAVPLYKGNSSHGHSHWVWHWVQHLH